MNAKGSKKVLVLGAGAQGNVVAWILARAGEVGSLVLADLDPRRAEETARNAGGGVKVEQADASDAAGIEALLRAGRFDLVVNTAIPEFIPRVMHAALAAGIDYLDLTSLVLHEREGCPVEQFEEAEAWRASGRTAFINGGSAPGLTNIMARESADELDAIDAIRIRDYSVVTSDELVTLWSPKVFLVDCATPPLIWDDGRPKRVPIFSGAEEYDFPPPVARRGTIYLHAHEEPATLPLFVGKRVRTCDYKIGEPDIDVWRFIVERLGLMDETPIEIGGARVSPRDLLLKKMPPTLSPDRLRALVAAGRLDGRTMVLTEVTGWKNGIGLRLTRWTESPHLRDAGAVIAGASDISLLTSVPAATFALMLLRGRLGRTGVVLPEMLDAAQREEFRREIARFGIRIATRTEPFPATG
ncbi:MAG: saccharopine dehydrogenase NADP-binding domain-containing protein [Candidatus Polarisedimenticolia bacterium]